MTGLRHYDSQLLAKLVLSSLCCSGIIAGSYIAIPIPISPVPIVLQNLFVLLSAFILGPRWSVICIALYLLLGAMGFPVFSAGGGGIGHFIGPSGGYLLSYLPAAFLCAGIAYMGKPNMKKDIIAASTGMIIIYVGGTFHLALIMGTGFAASVSIGILPFLPADIIKLVCLILIIKSLRKRGFITKGQDKGSQKNGLQAKSNL